MISLKKKSQNMPIFSVSRVA